MNKFEDNRKSWNEMTPLHVDSLFYDVAGFKKGASSLNATELQELGSIKGKKLLHLQCHFGLDTLSFARLGADVTGIDISDEAISTAQNLSEELSIPARFIRSNIYDTDKILTETYDIVYTSYGAINWLDDLDKWADLISQFLKPGGSFYMVEFHPLIFAMDEKQRFESDYFNTGEIVTDATHTYTENSEITKQGLLHREWNHPISDVINSLIKSKLSIQFVNEFPFQHYNCFPGMVERAKGEWIFQNVKTQIPYMYSIKAHKPA